MGAWGSKVLNFLVKIHMMILAYLTIHPSLGVSSLIIDIRDKRAVLVEDQILTRTKRGKPRILKVNIFGRFCLSKKGSGEDDLQKCQN